VVWSAVTPRSIKSQDLDCGRRFIPEDLILDLHRCEAPFVGATLENRQPGRAVVLARRRQQWFAMLRLSRCSTATASAVGSHQD